MKKFIAVLMLSLSVFSTTVHAYEIEDEDMTHWESESDEIMVNINTCKNRVVKKGTIRDINYCIRDMKGYIATGWHEAEAKVALNKLNKRKAKLLSGN